MKPTDLNLYNNEGDPASLKDVCYWWLFVYPEDVFVKEPELIVLIRACAKELLKQIGELE